MRKSIWTQNVNFVISIVFIGSAALLGMVLMLRAAEMDNPIESHLRVLVEEGDLER
ncbi:MAG: hypothetical protein WA021_02855 [Minisyncoccia bacterium]